MITFEDGQNNTIATAEHGAAIYFHNRLIINPMGYYEEGEQVIIFTKEEFKIFQNHHSDKLDHVIELGQECVKHAHKLMKQIESKNHEIEELKENNKDFKRLNIKLAQIIQELKIKNK